MDTQSANAAALQATIDAQAREIEELKSRLEAQRVTRSRRDVLKGAGAVAGGLAAIGAVSAAGSAITATPAAAAGWEAAPEYGAAPSGALFLTANGEEIRGDDTRVGSEDAIEFFYYQHKVSNQISRAGTTGKRTHEPIQFRKRIDKSSPLLYKALCNNEVIEGVFKFFRPGGKVGTENHYSVAIKNGRIASINELQPDNHAIVALKAGASEVAMEEVSFVFHTITWTYTDGGIEHTDTWSGKA